MATGTTPLRFHALRFGGLILAVLSLALISGCYDGNGKPGQARKLRIGLMITPRGLNDRGFNDMAFAGLKSAERRSGIEAVLIEPATMKEPQSSLRFFAGQNFDAIIAVGIAFLDDIRAISREHPELPFYVIDWTLSEGNIRGISFREEEGSFLAGYLAASTAKSGKVGFIGGAPIDVIRRFAAGYHQGVAAAASSTEVVDRWLTEDFTGFNSPDLAKNTAQELYRSGCDVIYHAAGASGLGVISAAVEAKKFVIGVDMNQDSLAPGLVLTSMLKRVDLVVEDIIRNLQEGKGPESVKLSYGMGDGAIDLTDFQFSRQAVGDELIGRLGQLKLEITSGRRKLESTLAVGSSTPVVMMPSARPIASGAMSIASEAVPLPASDSAR